MQIVKSDGQYRVYGENIEVYDKLDPNFYQFMVDDHGPFLVRTTKPEINGKVYGSDQNKVNKCIDTYNHFDRSLGIMLVGDKGNGKTLFAKQLCIKMLNAGYPVINITEYHPALPSFMLQMSQECVFLFDEFEKMFEHNETRGSAQNLMLSTFDGVNMSKKMFIITCNEIDRLSRYIYNRPGRFHYSFTFTEPNYDDIEEYLNDNINTDTCVEQISDIALFCYINGLNYDCMRSLTFELNNGYSLIETFDDLNIGYGETKMGTVRLIFTNNEVLKGTFDYDKYEDKPVICSLYSKAGWCVATVSFKMSNVKYDPEKDLYILPNDIIISYRNVASVEGKEFKDAITYHRDLVPLYMSMQITNHKKMNPLRNNWNDYGYDNRCDCGVPLDDSEYVEPIETTNSTWEAPKIHVEATPSIGFHPKGQILKNK